jgi:hypothetical protein
VFFDIRRRATRYGSTIVGRSAVAKAMADEGGRIKHAILPNEPTVFWLENSIYQFGREEFMR